MRIQFAIWASHQQLEQLLCCALIILSENPDYCVEWVLPEAEVGHNAEISPYKRYRCP